MRKKIVAGNWKMNMLPEEAEKLFNSLLVKKDWPENVEIIVFPPVIYINQFSEFKDANIQLGVQNFFPRENGAFTGEISITQVKACGAKYALIGHSERRAFFGEHEAFLKEKIDAAMTHEILPIFCCGEPLEIRENNKEKEFVKNQLVQSLFHLNTQQISKVTIAYEPVWAIGTGKTATIEQAEDMHRSIREWLVEKYSMEIANEISILYGGSCTPDNAEKLFACPNVDGGLIGGASLKADLFTQIIESH
jgi:triosephosphate isomerase|tara:strand:- start:30149 stop:30898 length:750 start_codon:yes stop_codon:yes gene_type:complete